MSNTPSSFALRKASSESDARRALRAERALRIAAEARAAELAAELDEERASADEMAATIRRLRAKLATPRAA